MPRVWMPRISRRPPSSGTPIDDLAVEAAGAAQRLVDRLGPVGGGDDDQILPRLEPVHQRQQLGDEALLGLALVTWPRLGAIESISSMKMIEGAACAASSNTSRSRFSLSP